MKPNEIVEKIKAENPKLLGSMDDKTAAKVVRAALELLGKNLASANEGVVKVMGLGQFRIRNVEREKDGKKEAVKKVSFRAAKPMDEAKKQEKRAARKSSNSAA